MSDAEQMREACAKVAEEYATLAWAEGRRPGDRRYQVATEIAAAIRALPLSQPAPADAPKVRRPWTDMDEAVDALHERGRAENIEGLQQALRALREGLS